MNRLADNQNPQGQDIDALLGTFFKAQLPNPWPAFQPPRKEKVVPFRPAVEERAGFAISSKFALALSLALLMLCGWLLSGSLPGPSPKGPRPPIEGPINAKKDQGKPPDLSPELRPEPSPRKPGKVRSEIKFEQGDKEQSIRIDVRELPSNK